MKTVTFASAGLFTKPHAKTHLTRFSSASAADPLKNDLIRLLAGQALPEAAFRQLDSRLEFVRPEELRRMFDRSDILSGIKSRLGLPEDCPPGQFAQKIATCRQTLPDEQRFFGDWIAEMLMLENSGPIY